MLALALVACPKGEDCAGPPEQSGPWHLHSIDGAVFQEVAQVEFGPDDQIKGQAPCNAFTALLDAGLPEFVIGEMIVTDSICDEIEAESRFLSALQDMDRMRMQGEDLVLSNDAGREMVFRLQDSR